MLKEIVILSLIAYVACSFPGGFEDANVDDEDVKVAAEHAARVLSKKFNSRYHHKLVKIVKAKKQVVAGVNYRIDVIVGETTCKKSEVKYEDVSSCDLNEGVSTYKKCQVLVFRDLKDNHKVAKTGCILTSKVDV